MGAVVHRHRDCSRDRENHIFRKLQCLEAVKHGGEDQGGDIHDVGCYHHIDGNCHPSVYS